MYVCGFKDIGPLACMVCEGVGGGGGMESLAGVVGDYIWGWGTWGLWQWWLVVGELGYYKYCKELKYYYLSLPT